MNLLSFALATIFSLALDTAWVALFRARPVGTFKVLRDTADTFSFSSNHGIFTVDQRSQTLRYVFRKQRSSWNLSDIKGLEYRVNEEHAVLEEFFFGLYLLDLLARYQDTVEWFSISAVTTEGKRIPLYLSGQYYPREFLLGWYIRLQAALLSRMGLLTDVEEESRAVVKVLQAGFRNPKLL